MCLYNNVISIFSNSGDWSQEHTAIYHTLKLWAYRGRRWAEVTAAAGLGKLLKSSRPPDPATQPGAKELDELAGPREVFTELRGPETRFEEIGTDW